MWDIIICHSFCLPDGPFTQKNCTILGLRQFLKWFIFFPFFFCFSWTYQVNMELRDLILSLDHIICLGLFALFWKIAPDVIFQDLLCNPVSTWASTAGGRVHSFLVRNPACSAWQPYFTPKMLSSKSLIHCFFELKWGFTTITLWYAYMPSNHSAFSFSF